MFLTRDTGLRDTGQSPIVSRLAVSRLTSRVSRPAVSRHYMYFLMVHFSLVIFQSSMVRRSWLMFSPMATTGRLSAANLVP